MVIRNPIRSLREFFQLEYTGSLLLLGAALLALFMKNNAYLASIYETILVLPIQIRIGPLNLDKHLLHWVNDGLMALFFLLVTLELKREMLVGQLSKLSQVTLPIIAAVGGMVVPALIYISINYHSDTLAGWAIPSATDIAFSLSVLALLGKRVPIALRLFLMTLAIVDDLGAILIIAFFYSGHELHLLSLGIVAGVMLVLFLFNLKGVNSITAYLMMGLLLWLGILNSGLHATLAGVALAIFIPLDTQKEDSEENYRYSPLRQLEHNLHPWVAFLILPLFAFANSGVSFQGFTYDVLFEPLPLGIILGLLLGKLVGVFGFSWITVKLGLAAFPHRATATQLLGVALLCGIGFTMSLFIGTLAFNDETYLNAVRLGVLVGSLLSALSGYLILYYTSPK
ncbi:MAG: Na+/H+ antiporter NhaA [Pseudomonadota bacterium]|nr:Na+/H+ antiporter NhaA [Pseudomonadota bacterium]